MYFPCFSTLYFPILISSLHLSLPLPLSAAEKPQRKRGCMECAGCKREDRGTCRNCKDMVKFGGPGRKKQKCALRVCLSQQSNDNTETH